jgi:hypothetical protein
LLTADGLQVPLILLVEVFDNVGAVAPVQIAGNAANVGAITGLTVCVNVVVNAHWPASGVKVYVPVAVLLTVAGLHVPVILLVDVPDNVGAADPLQIGASAANAGVIVAGFIVCVNVVVTAH